jgi:hypothetical protein
MADQMVAKPLKRYRKQLNKSTIRILEEAVHLLRLAPGNLLLYYYIGSLPFILALLYFWADMSCNAYAANYCAIASLGIALLFVWMKSWQTVFALKIRAVIENKPQQRWLLRHMISMVVHQSLIHASGFIVLPIALLLMLPFGWCYAFYQNASVLDYEDPPGLKTICQKSWQQAKLWPKQNHLLISVFFLFGMVVFINLVLALFILPHLLKTILGIETIFTLSGIKLLNTTFLAIITGFTYLCMDPIIKTAYVLRCYYGGSAKSGEDIRTQLSHFLKQVNAPICFLIIIMSLSQTTAFAWQSQASLAAVEQFPQGTVIPEMLDQSIEEVLSQPDFTWRMPREKIQKDKAASGPVAEAIDWLLGQLRAGLKKIWQWLEAFLDWLLDLWPREARSPPDSQSGWQDSVRILLIILLILIVITLTFFFYRFWQRRGTTTVEVVSEAMPSVPNLSEEGIKADDLPANRWLIMAKELMAKGSFQLAMRALYLATLAHLAEHNLLTIEIYKSNRDYERELQRRAHENEDLLTDFAKMGGLFDSVWYGMYDVAPSDFTVYATIQERIMAIAE